MGKDYRKVIDKFKEEVAEFQKTDETQKQILHLELEGVDAITFRLIVGGCNIGEEVNIIKRIIHIGLASQLKVLIDSLEKKEGR